MGLLVLSARQVWRRWHVASRRRRHGLSAAFSKRQPGFLSATSSFMMRSSALRRCMDDLQPILQILVSRFPLARHCSHGRGALGEREKQRHAISHSDASNELPSNTRFRSKSAWFCRAPSAAQSNLPRTVRCADCCQLEVAVPRIFYASRTFHRDADTNDQPVSHKTQLEPQMSR